MAKLAAIAALVLSVPVSAGTSSINSISGGEKVACAKFKLKFPEQTYFPGSAGYAYETQSSEMHLKFYEA